MPQSTNRPPSVKGKAAVKCSRQAFYSREVLDFQAINEAVRPHLTAILRRILPGGKVMGREYVALNPRRNDGHLGSFKVNLLTGRWADFAVRASGSDVTSLVAYLFGLSQTEAARRVMQMIGGV